MEYTLYPTDKVSKIKLDFDEFMRKTLGFPETSKATTQVKKEKQSAPAELLDNYSNLERITRATKDTELGPKHKVDVDTYLDRYASSEDREDSLNNLATVTNTRTILPTDRTSVGAYQLTVDSPFVQEAWNESIEAGGDTAAKALKFGQVVLNGYREEFPEEFEKFLTANKIDPSKADDQETLKLFMKSSYGPKAMNLQANLRKSIGSDEEAFYKRKDGSTSTKLNVDQMEQSENELHRKKAKLIKEYEESITDWAKTPTFKKGLNNAAATYIAPVTSVFKDSFEKSLANLPKPTQKVFKASFQKVADVCISMNVNRPAPLQKALKEVAVEDYDFNNPEDIQKYLTNIESVVEKTFPKDFRSKASYRQTRFDKEMAHLQEALEPIREYLNSTLQAQKASVK